MEQFPNATELPRIYSLEGHEGEWNQVKYAEAKVNPSAVRALKKNTIAWFVPVVEIDDLSELIEENQVEAV